MSLFPFISPPEIESLFGQGFQLGFIESETKRFIKEALIVNPYITHINKIDVTFEGDTLKASVYLETIYGSLNVQV